MSLTKIPFVFIAGLCLQVTFNVPKSNKVVQKNQRKMGDDLIEILSVVFIARVSQTDSHTVLIEAPDDFL